MPRPGRLEALYAVALASQAALLARIAGADLPGMAAAFLVGSAAAHAFLAVLGRRSPEVAAMLAIGGLGMTLGWSADLAVPGAAQGLPHASAALDTIWCRTPSGAGPTLGHLLSFMNAGMLAFGLPAMAFARRVRRSDHAPGSLLACALGMIAGMSAGSSAAARLAASLDPTLAVVCDWLGMTLGMLAGMALVHACGAAFRRTSARVPGAAAAR